MLLQRYKNSPPKVSNPYSSPMEKNTAKRLLTLQARLLSALFPLAFPLSLFGQPAEADNLRHFQSNGNPLITHLFTCDPATMVEGDTLWLYTGHDQAGGQTNYKLKDWKVFSTTDLTHWTEHPTPLRVSDFKWDRSGAAYAGQCIQRDGKYYFYISTNGSGIGVAVADRPEGPFHDAIGRPLLTNADCAGATHSWVCIDPAVFIDDDGQAWLFWGNRQCYAVKLKRNMVETEGPILRIDIPGGNYTEAPWVHKRNGKYYLSFATGFPEKLAYAMADSICGPYTYKGLLTEMAGNSNTIHPAISRFRGQWILFYHNGAIQPDGGSYSRSVCADYLHHRSDGTIAPVAMTTEGVDRDYVPFDNASNPAIKGYYADPEVMYAEQTKRYYIYPTSDGFDGWSGHYFKTFSSSDLQHWKDEGKILDLRSDIRWANDYAWAPCIIERPYTSGKGRKRTTTYKYFYYYSANKQIGVAVADRPEGPFKDPIGKPLVNHHPKGQTWGQEIDPDVFFDPQSGKYFLYWGNGYMAGVELHDDMTSFDADSVKLLTPCRSYNEGTYVFFRQGTYYFLWSENDTRSEDYRVCYGMASSPLGPIRIPKNNCILSKRSDKGIYGTGHNSVIQLPGTDEWRIIYHRFHRPNAVKMSDGAAGYNREVCIDKMRFNADGTIQTVEPTL